MSFQGSLNALSDHHTIRQRNAMFGNGAKCRSFDALMLLYTPDAMDSMLSVCETGTCSGLNNLVIRFLEAAVNRHPDSTNHAVP
mmetsp:Transcript_8407/g.15213  ORF Transcript_8407/g.15213 Transcript_8407/m.15213 type:complete len:84 (-) Transcript_8407:327-578(-)